MRFDASGVPTLSPERIPFEWKRDTLCFILSGVCPYRKTGVHPRFREGRLFPGHALSDFGS